MKRFILFLIALATCAATLSAETEDTRQIIISPDFHTLKVQNPDAFLAPPTITLSGDDRITISFDEFTSDRSYLCCSLYHCNADWQPSALLEQEYADGFNKAYIDDVGFSRTTFRQYVNYRITVPSEDTKPLVSGNYLLKVYPEDDPEDILLQARFCVNEDIVPITGEASIHTDRGSDGLLQQLDLNIDTRSLQGVDPYSEIIVVVQQNSDPNTRTITTRPFRVEQGKVLYRHNPDLIFRSGNEWRRFETVRANYPGMHVDSTRYNGDCYVAYLTPDEGLADKPYLYDQTQFGRFIIDEYNSSDPDLGADYIDTEFALDFPRVMNARIYLDGEFTNHLLLDEYELNYDTYSHTYRATVPLKQGSYNYRYVAVPTDESGNACGKPDPRLTEGDKAETANEYLVQVFLRKHGSRADRLVGETTIYTSL